MYERNVHHVAHDDEGNGEEVADLGIGDEGEEDEGEREEEAHDGDNEG